MFTQSLVKSDPRSGGKEEDQEELLSQQDRDDYNVMPHFKNRVSCNYDIDILLWGILLSNKLSKSVSCQLNYH